MHIDKINNLTFEAGNVRLNGIQQKSLYTFDSIKKIAEDRGVDIFISKNKASKNLECEDLYTIISSLFMNKKTIKGSAFAILRKIGPVSAEENSVKIYNAVIQSIENLNRRFLQISK